MRKLKFVLLVGIGLMNLIPVIGAISAEQLTNLYGANIESVDLEILMRHRAVMLGLIGGFLLLAAFRSSLQIPAATIGLVSMASFVFIAYSSGGGGTHVSNVAIADVAGSLAAAVVLAIALKDRRK